jgi:hypothetical protein
MNKKKRYIYSDKYATLYDNWHRGINATYLSKQRQAVKPPPTEKEWNITKTESHLTIWNSKQVIIFMRSQTH